VLGQVVQVAGALLILVAFGALQLRKLRAEQVSYLLLNLAGSGTLAVLALIQRQWGFVLLEGVWAIVSAASFITPVLRSWRRRGHPAGSQPAANSSAHQGVRKTQEFVPGKPSVSAASNHHTGSLETSPSVELWNWPAWVACAKHSTG
jgi:hypothetical protein